MIKYGGMEFEDIKQACDYMHIDFNDLNDFMAINVIIDYEDGLKNYIKKNFIFTKGLLFKTLEAACYYNHVDVEDVKRLMKKGYGFDLSVQMIKRGMKKI